MRGGEASQIGLQGGRSLDKAARESLIGGLDCGQSKRVQVAVMVTAGRLPAQVRKRLSPGSLGEENALSVRECLPHS